MAHTLEITFNNLADFNTNFAKFKKDNSMLDDFNIIKSDVVINDKPTWKNSDVFNHSLIGRDKQNAHFEVYQVQDAHNAHDAHDYDKIDKIVSSNK